MSETASATPSDSAAPPEERKKKKEEGSFAWFLVKLVVVVLLFRTLVFTSFSIPSESMMPRLLEGDYLFAAKWPYGYSRASLPLDVDLFSGRVPNILPHRGDVVVFKHPVDRADYIKRVVGLPGDQVQMVAGVLHLNGQPVKKVKMADLLIPVRPQGRCAEGRFVEEQANGTFSCRYPRFRETLPGGPTYEVLDFGLTWQDTTQPVIVPEGRLFLMGDNRDNSLDSRFPAEAGQGIGLVPVENVVGRASFVFFSTDGTAEWLAVDLVHRRPLVPHREGHLSAPLLQPATRKWLEKLGFTVKDEARWAEALTHGSSNSARNYERLEFLGDRVLGLSIAEWLYQRQNGPEGELAQRLNALVSRQMCASIAREIGAPAHVLLGKQARDDGAQDSDNVLGDIMEALLGASFLESGFTATRDVVRAIWQDAVEGRAGRSKHPKSALQEWAAGCRRKPPEYELVNRSGPDHAASFTVRVSVRKVGEVEATASSKQDAETEAARLFMEKFG